MVEYAHRYVVTGVLHLRVLTYLLTLLTNFIYFLLTHLAFSTDNGPEEPMVFTNGVASANPFRGRKRSLYDGGIRLPFIIAFPGQGAFHVEFIFHFSI